ncbi:MAG: hypothetical protein HYZ46_04430 [Nitrosomonadales bacterium]|nr:hypothetical protein [Nitrosomonadales bacterium]
MQTVNPDLKIHTNRTRSALGILPNRSSPKSPKINELLTRHGGFQRRWDDLKLSAKP